MDLAKKGYEIHISQSLSAANTPIFRSPPHSSAPGFPIIAVAVIGILATAFLLVSYYVFVIKCCLNWHRIDLLRRFASSRNRPGGSLEAANSPGPPRRGLEESVIQSIPIFHFKGVERTAGDCAVCLNEFREEEKLRAIPNCGHVFHVDCIDVWLQSNDNCPLCRTSISYPYFPLPRIAAPSSSPINPGPAASISDEDFVVIELGEANSVSTDRTLLRVQERLNSGEFPAKIKPKMVQRRGKKLNHLSSMGDECIDIRAKDDEFGRIQPVRRSFSMDSACDRQLYLAVQEIVEKNGIEAATSAMNEGCSSRVRSFFSFANGKGSTRAVLPVALDP